MEPVWVPDHREDVRSCSLAPGSQGSLFVVSSIAAEAGDAAGGAVVGCSAVAVSEKGTGQGQGLAHLTPPSLHFRAAHGLPALLAENIFLQLGLTDTQELVQRGPCVFCCSGQGLSAPQAPSLIKLTLVVSSIGSVSISGTSPGSSGLQP